MKILKFRKSVLGLMASSFVGGGALLAAPSAQAADGCKFLLCIAGAWRGIAECRPVVFEVFRDLARGRVFPTCAMSGGGNEASNLFVSEPTCPIMYREYSERTGSYVRCRYPGQVTVQINGEHWSTVYWDYNGNTSTQWSNTALASLSQHDGAALDQTFANDIRAWNSYQVNQCAGQGGTPIFNGYGAFERCDIPDQGQGRNR